MGTPRTDPAKQILDGGYHIVCTEDSEEVNLPSRHPRWPPYTNSPELMGIRIGGTMMPVKDC